MKKYIRGAVQLLDGMSAEDLIDLARDKGAPSYLLEALTDWLISYGDYNSEVTDTLLKYVSLNRNTPLSSLNKIIDNLNPSRYFLIFGNLVTNPNVPLETIKQLIEQERGLAVMALKNPNVNLDFLLYLSEHSSATVRQAVASDSRLPDYVMQRMVEDSSWLVRLGLARNPKVPNDILQKLAKDKNGSVRCESEYKLLRRRVWS